MLEQIGADGFFVIGDRLDIDERTRERKKIGFVQLSITCRTAALRITAFNRFEAGCEGEAVIDGADRCLRLKWGQRPSRSPLMAALA